jgi:hypothetical protein
MRAGETVLRLVFLAATKGAETSFLNRREQRNDFHSKAAKATETEDILQKATKVTKGFPTRFWLSVR